MTDNIISQPFNLSSQSDPEQQHQFYEMLIPLTTYQQHQEKILAVCQQWENTQILHWEEFPNKNQFGILFNQGSIVESLNEIQKVLTHNNTGSDQ